jgi:hypothetical protein
MRVFMGVVFGQFLLRHLVETGREVVALGKDEDGASGRVGVCPAGR